MTADTPKLPDGLYPFIDQRLPLSEMAMVEAPPKLEALFRTRAAANGIEIIRDISSCRRRRRPNGGFQ